MICAKCGSLIGDGEMFCGECGNRVDQNAGNGAAGGTANKKICRVCGSELNITDTFCGSCGSSVDAGGTGASGFYNAGGYPGAPAREQAYAASGAAPGRKKTNKGLIITICALSAAAVAAIAVFLLFFTGILNFGNENEDVSISGSSAQTVVEEKDERSRDKETFEPKGNGTVVRGEAASTVAPTATAVPAPVFTSAQASSIRGTDSLGGTYSVESILTRDNMTKWVPAKNTGSGIGQWVQISASSPQYVKGIYILNGYHKNFETWSKNNRVSSCTIAFSNGKTRDFVLSDTMDLITLDLGETVETTSVRLTINGVYRGSAWDDTAITYLGVY